MNKKSGAVILLLFILFIILLNESGKLPLLHALVTAQPKTPAVAGTPSTSGLPGVIMSGALSSADIAGLNGYHANTGMLSVPSSGLPTALPNGQQIIISAP